MIFQDLVGKKFNKLLVIKYVGKEKCGQSRWLCQCDCGNKHEATGSHLKNGNIKSCGCLLTTKLRSQAAIVHGWCYTPEYNSYHSAKKRCNPNNIEKYKEWVGRGIEFRFNNFQEFIEHIGPRPEPKFDYSLERINNNGHYEIGNVKWATKEEQARNRRCDRCLKLEERIKELEAKIAQNSS